MGMEMGWDLWMDGCAGSRASRGRRDRQMLFQRDEHTHLQYILRVKK